MIITDMCGGLTLQEMEVPPLHVLDLGCGSGMWILAAAREWTVSLTVFPYYEYEIHIHHGNSRTLHSLDSIYTNASQISRGQYRATSKNV